MDANNLKSNESVMNHQGLVLGVGWTANGLAELLDGEWINPPANDWKAVNFVHSGEGVLISENNTVLILREHNLKKLHTAKRRVVGLVSLEPALDAPDDIPQLIIKSDIKLVQKKLAESTRPLMNGKIVGVAGSVGKTSTKDMLAHVLEHFGAVRSTRGTYNTVGSLYHTFAESAVDPDFAVLEVTTHLLSRGWKSNSNGRLVSPHCVIITFVCLEHADELGFKNEFDAARTNARLCEYMQPNSICFIPYEMRTYEYIKGIVTGYGCTPISYGYDENADVRIESIAADVDGSIIEANIFNEKVSYKLPKYGKGMALNSLAVLSVVQHFGLDVHEGAKQLLTTPFTNSRQELKTINLAGGELRIINDCFNAQLPSVFDAIDALKNIPNPGGRKVAILGFVKNFENDPEKGYLPIAKTLTDSGFDHIFLIGEKIREITMHLKPNTYTCFDFPPSDDTLKKITSFLKPHDVVLVKSSEKDNLALRLIKTIKARKTLAR